MSKNIWLDIQIKWAKATDTWPAFSSVYEGFLQFYKEEEEEEEEEELKKLRTGK